MPGNKAAATEAAGSGEAQHLVEAAVLGAVLGAVIGAAMVILAGVVSKGGGTIGIGTAAGITKVLARASTLDMAHRTTTVPIPTLPERAATIMLTATGTPIPDATRPIRTGPIDVLLSEPVNVK